VLHQSGARCKALPHCTGAFPFHMVNTAMVAAISPGAERLESLEAAEGAEGAGGAADRSCLCSSHSALRHAHRR
jgi:hypothetical protein